MKNYILQLLFAGFMLMLPSNLSGQNATIMSYNIRYDNPNDNENSWDQRKEALVDLIAYYHPDFLGIQEGLFNQVDYISDHTKNYAMIGVGRDDGKKAGEFVALYYDAGKYELIDQKTFWLSQSPDIPSKSWDAALNRICTYGLFKEKNGNRRLHVFNTHFDHRGPEARKMSAKLILEKIEDYAPQGSQVVVMGDLNSAPQSEPILLLTAELEDGRISSKKKFYGPIGTFNNFDKSMVPDRRIDYIFVKNLGVTYYRHIDDRRPNNYWVSDHLPILIEIEYPSSN